MKETELASEIINYYEKNNYTIYSEVIFKSGSKRADIVAVHNDTNEYVVIEVKKTMNLKLIEQCHYWKDKAHKVYCFFISKRKLNYFAINLLNDYGIGAYIYRGNKIKKIHDSSMCSDPTLPKLYEEQKDSIGGSTSSSSYVTPFKLTVKKLINYVNEKGGSCTLNSAIDNIDHHYSSKYSARNSLIKMIKTDVIKEIFLEKNNKIFFLKSK